jgi:type I restriction-modification system DNA methylase subunit
MNTEEIRKKEKIESALAALSTGDFSENAKHLLAILGYCSERTVELPGTAGDFIQRFPARNKNTETEQEFLNSVESVKLVFQVTSEEIAPANQPTLFESPAFDAGYVRSFLFFAIELTDKDYPRGTYAQFTREVNKRFMMPIVALFRVGNRLTIGFVGRRQHQYDPDRDVLEQVTLIKDIRLDDPHRAHIEVLYELALWECAKWVNANNQPENFDGLLAAWLARLDTEALNKKFYRELFAWFEWAVAEGKFPTDKNRTVKPEEHAIRLITRLLFVWFIKEKGLIADDLFNEAQIAPLLKDYDHDAGDSYYRAVLQNLFFATLNTEIEKRQFTKGGNTGHRNFSLYRYKDEITEPDELLALFAQTPFINGGLFDCLDSEEATRDGGYRIDCFSDVHYNKLSIPNRLFFDDDCGLIPLLEHYKFTVEENTPIEQDVALDPELLGKAFENLLAAYNPETGETARRQTGSYYTPRAIVDYMVDEALVAALSQKCNLTEDWLRSLLDYTQVSDNGKEWSDNPEANCIVKTISQLKILDPAVGSGAFPMGILHKLTLALRRLDPDNTFWEQLQRDRAGQRAADTFNIKDDQVRSEELLEIDKTFRKYRDSDFGRKLYLIQNSIFGVDIQSIACQIAKLRFFISLIIEQEPDKDVDNFGIKPLPNLETRFIAADTLIGLKEERTLTSSEAQGLERQLGENRERYFHATTRSQKLACKREDKRLRRELAAELRDIGMPADDAEKIAAWDLYDQNASAAWFDAEWMFGITDEFDVVTGNPPYIQLEKDGGRLGRLYESCNYDSFSRKGDIYCLFYEKANQLLKNGGHTCFITSNKWMRAGYGKNLRGYFIEHTQPIQLLDMGPDVFDATVDTNILLSQNSPSNARPAFTATIIKSDFDKHTGDIAQYLKDNGITMVLPAKGESWVILSSSELALKHKIEEVGKPLKDWDINIYNGIKTGCNKAFIIDETKRQELIAQDPRSDEIIKPFLRGRDIKRYHIQWAGLYMLATGYDLDIPNEYPAIYNYLETIGERIESERVGTRRKGLFNRSDQGENWWNLRACAYYSEFEKEKVVYPETTLAANFFCDEGQHFIEKTCFMITGSDVKILVGLLSSTLMTYAYKQYCSGTVLGNKGYQYNKHALEKLSLVKNLF